MHVERERERAREREGERGRESDSGCYRHVLFKEGGRERDKEREREREIGSGSCRPVTALFYLKRDEATRMHAAVIGRDAITGAHG